jgi:hypothetical protein
MSGEDTNTYSYIFNKMASLCQLVRVASLIRVANPNKAGNPFVFFFGCHTLFFHKLAAG